MSEEIDEKALNPEDLIRPSDNPDYRSNPNNKRTLVHLEGETTDYHADIFGILDRYDNREIGSVFYSIDPSLEDFGDCIKLIGSRQLLKADYPILYNKLLGTPYLESEDLTHFVIIDFLQYPYLRAGSSLGLIEQNLPNPNMSIASASTSHNHTFNGEVQGAGNSSVEGLAASAYTAPLIFKNPTGRFSLTSSSKTYGYVGGTELTATKTDTHKLNLSDDTRPVNGTINTTNQSHSHTPSVGNINYTNDQEVRPNTAQMYLYMYCDKQEVQDDTLKTYRVDGKTKVYRNLDGSTTAKKFRGKKLTVKDVETTGTTTDTTLEREETALVEIADFFDISKIDKDKKISATNLILGLLKLSVPSDFDNAAAPVIKDFTDIIGQVHYLIIADCHNKKIMVNSSLATIQPNSDSIYQLQPDFTGLQNGELFYLYIDWAYFSGGTKTNGYKMLSTIANTHELYVSTAMATNTTVPLARGWYKYQGGILLPCS